MRLHSVLLVFVFVSIIALSLHDYAWTSVNLDKKARLLQKAYTQKRFMAESFRNTCRGKGFSSLEEWQNCCSSMFHLEYISWCDSKEFLEQPDTETSVLMYGKWICQDLDKGSGEVFCNMEESIDEK